MATLSKGVTLAHILKKQAEEQAKDSEETEFIEQMTKDHEKVAEMIFVIGDFSVHCISDDGIIVPAEGSVVAFSLNNGAIAQWHSILKPGVIPLGYRGECLENARKTHNIPFGNNWKTPRFDRLTSDCSFWSVSESGSRQSENVALAI